MSRLFRLLAVAAVFPISAASQTATPLTGRISSADGVALSGADATLSNPLTRYSEAVVAAGTGVFAFSNVPLGEYRLSVTMAGFDPWPQTVSLRSPVPLDLPVKLAVAAQRESVKVTASKTMVALDTAATGTRTELNQAAIEHRPKPVGTRGLEAVLLSVPGFAADANGAIHPRGAHN